MGVPDAYSWQQVERTDALSRFQPKDIYAEPSNSPMQNIHNQKSAFSLSCRSTSFNSLSVYLSAMPRGTQLWFIAIWIARSLDTLGVDFLLIIILRCSGYYYDTSFTVCLGLVCSVPFETEHTRHTSCSGTE